MPRPLCEADEAPLRRPRNYGNPGAMDMRGYLRRRGIDAVGSMKAAEIELLDGRGGSRAGAWIAAARRSVLARMNRRCRSGRIREAVTLLRSSKEDPYIAADIIAGFPGETEADFADTRDFVEELSFAALHVFPFSPRPGTAAFGFKPAVPERTRHQRARELRARGRLSVSSYTRSWVGRDVDVLLEGQESARGWGVSGNYLKVDVSGVPAADDVEGSIVRARITSAHGTCRSIFLGIA